ncbi:hypothetical protein COLO4_10657 [Corchorus olitorius]|uniref:Uncharacterized protein n=1 Tax=Corchorus olitorius TaxID=93759 RepID=A0A1R3K7I7_9ROSI|nr:hypothetical protein COLO4_10657 [Corchorus olitorius]
MDDKSNDYNTVMDMFCSVDDNRGDVWSKTIERNI